MAATRNDYSPPMVSHPGQTLSEKLEEIGMGNKEFAIRVHKPEQTITAITSGKSSITAEMAVQFEDVLKIPASFWLTRQRQYDEYLARIKREQKIIAAIDWAKGFPYAQMAKLGMVPSTRKIKEKVVNLFSFFGVSDHKAWEAYYFKQSLKVNFRISLAHTKEAKAVSAWLRQGEIQAKDIYVSEYDSSLLRKSLVEIKTLMAQNPSGFFTQLKVICANSGVKLVYTPCLPKAPIHGSTRWVGNNPLIQLSARYKSNDIFWFTFFHEIGHILKHGKKYISIENINHSDKDEKKEKEADDFAIEYTLNLSQEKQVLSAGWPLSRHQILSMAKAFNTHPGIIIGRLHRLQILPYSQGREYIETIDLTD